MTILGVVMSFSTQQEKGKLVVKIRHYVGNSLLQLDSARYTNALGQTFTISNFKYYISNVELKKMDGKIISFPGSFLVNEEDAASKQFVLNAVAEGNYSSMSFILGVDSAHNCSGAQSGALDPVNAMFWAWNSGYIFLKLEGKSPASQSPGHIFEYHIGGYKHPANCIRRIVLNFEHPVAITGKTTDIILKADASELLKTPVDIDFSKLSSVTDHRNATLIADNYKDMFSILQPGDEK